MFTAIHRIAELRDRDDLVVLVIQNLDYTLSARACSSLSFPGAVLRFKIAGMAMLVYSWDER